MVIETYLRHIYYYARASLFLEILFYYTQIWADRTKLILRGPLHSYVLILLFLQEFQFHDPLVDAGFIKQRVKYISCKSLEI